MLPSSPASSDQRFRSLPGSVVLVDDDPAVRAAVSFALEIDGFEVRAFADAEAMLDDCTAEASCLVLDYRLPGQNGLDLLQTLRESGSNVPAVLITSQPKVSVRLRAAELGASLVEKPLLDGELVDVVRRLSDTPR